MNGTVKRQTPAKTVIKMDNGATVVVKRLGARVFVTAWNMHTQETPKTVKQTYGSFNAAHEALTRIVAQFTGKR